MRDNDRKIVDRKMRKGNMGCNNGRRPKAHGSRLGAARSPRPPSGILCSTHTYEGTRTMIETVCAKPLPATVYGGSADVQRGAKRGGVAQITSLPRAARVERPAINPCRNCAGLFRPTRLEAQGRATPTTRPPRPASAIPCSRSCRCPRRESRPRAAPRPAASRRAGRPETRSRWPPRARFPAW